MYPSGRIRFILAVVLCALLITCWLLWRSFLTSERLIETVNSQVADISGFDLAAHRAQWSPVAPFDVTLQEVILATPDTSTNAGGSNAVHIERLRLSLNPRALLSLKPRLAVGSVVFDDLRLGSSGSSPADVSARGTGLQGSLEMQQVDAGSPGWEVHLEGQNLAVQPVLDFLGSALEMQVQVDLQGHMTARGSDIEALSRTLTGEIVISGGPGRLDARGIRALNRGPVRWARQSGHFVDWPDVMDFAHLEAAFNVRRGLADTTFHLAFENMSLEGAGGVDFLAETMDYNFELFIASSDEQATFQAGEYLADTPWPIRCRGSFAQRLPCRLDQTALIDVAMRLIKRDAQDVLSETFGEVFQEFRDESQ